MPGLEGIYNKTNFNSEATSQFSAKEAISNFCGRTWKVISYPFVWLVEKIIAIWNWIFGSGDESKTVEEPIKPVENKDNTNTTHKKSFIPHTTTRKLTNLAKRGNAAKENRIKQFLENNTKTVESITKKIDTISDAYFNAGADSDSYLVKLEPLRLLRLLNDEVQTKFRQVQQNANDAKGIADVKLKNQAEELLTVLNGLKENLNKKIETHTAQISSIFLSVACDLTEEHFSDEGLREEWFSILKFLESCSKDQNPLKEISQAITHALELIRSYIKNLAAEREAEYQKLLQLSRSFDQGEKNQSSLPPNISTIGIPNVGNTCFMNSVLQAVLHSPKLSAAIDREMVVKPPQRRLDPNEKKLNEGLKGFKNTYVQSVQEHKQAEIMRGPAANFRNLIYTGATTLEGRGRQQDAGELLTSILTAIQVNYPLKTTTTVPKTEYKSIEINPSGILHLTLPKQSTAVTFKQLLNDFSKIEEKNDPHNEHYHEASNTWHSRYDRQESIVNEIPEILPIALKRFKYDKIRNRMEKIETPVEYDNGQEYDLKPLFDSEIQAKHDTIRYKLTTYINHINHLFWGHYTANIHKDGKWITCNDSSTAAALNERADRESAYILIFERVNSAAEEVIVQGIPEQPLQQPQQPNPTRQPLKQLQKPVQKMVQPIKRAISQPRQSVQRVQKQIPDKFDFISRPDKEEIITRAHNLGFKYNIASKEFVNTEIDEKLSEKEMIDLVKPTFNIKPIDKL